MRRFSEFDWVWLEKRLDTQRLEHTRGVMAAASELARRFGVNEEKAITAAFYHDCAKLKDKQQRQELLLTYGYIPSVEEEKSPQLLHAPLGALVAQHERGISDPEILNAIRYHTTGRAEMSDLEKLIYIADAIEENRDYPGVKELRDATQQSLNEGMLAIIEHTIGYLQGVGLPIGVQTIACQKWLLDMQKGWETTR